MLTPEDRFRGGPGELRSPSRMGTTAAHLVDRVLPAVPVRQWVLSPGESATRRHMTRSTTTATVFDGQAESLLKDLADEVWEDAG